MIKQIIEKIRKSVSLKDHEAEFLDYVIKRPTHEDYSELWLAGLT